MIELLRYTPEASRAKLLRRRKILNRYAGLLRKFLNDFGSGEGVSILAMNAGSQRSAFGLLIDWLGPVVQGEVQRGSEL